MTWSLFWMLVPLAFAQPKLALVNVALSGEAPPAVGKAIVGAVEKGLAEGGAQVMGRAQVVAVTSAHHVDVAQCVDARCRSKLLDALGAEAIVYVAAQVQLDLYHVTLEGYDRKGQPTVEQGSCEICTLAEATASVERLAAALATRYRAPVAAPDPPPEPAPLTLSTYVRSIPPGGQVRVNGVPLGVTDLVVDLTPGEHELTIDREGFQPWVKTLSLAPDTEPEAITAELFPLPPPAPPVSEVIPPAPAVSPDSGPRPLAVPTPAPLPPPAPAAVTPPSGLGHAAVYALLGGVTLLGTGGVLMGLDGEATCEGPLEACPTLYDTGNAGLASVALGGGALVGAVILFVLEQAATGKSFEQPPDLRP